MDIKYLQNCGYSTLKNVLEVRHYFFEDHISIYFIWKRKNNAHVPHIYEIIAIDKNLIPELFLLMT